MMIFKRSSENIVPQFPDGDNVIIHQHDHMMVTNWQWWWLQHYHYEDKTGWGPARDRCKENNGDLVIVNSEKENM